MKQEIKYGGYTANPSDHESADGDLTTSLNLISEEGQLKALPQPTVIANLPQGFEVVYIHKTAIYTHYIVRHSSSQASMLYWFDESVITSAQSVPTLVVGNNLFVLHDFSYQDSQDHTVYPAIYRIEAVGNTLVVLTQDALFYILWKPDTSAYLFIGNKPPFVNIEFGTSNLHPEDYLPPGTRESDYSSISREITNDLYTVTAHKVTFDSEVQDRITEWAWTLINSTNAAVTAEGHFYAPFYVRYCYRLYDGSMIMHSAPVFIPLTMPSTYRIMLPNFFTSTIDNSIYDIYASQPSGVSIPFVLGYLPSSVALTYRCSADDIANLQANWGDIVTSVDIFVSLPLTREDDSKKIETASQNTFPFYYKNNTAATIAWPSESIATTNVVFDIPMLDDVAYRGKIMDVGNYYKVRSFNLDEIQTGSSFTDVDIDGYVLQTLAAQEAMADDYKSHNVLLPSIVDGRCVSSLYSYNNRLNLAGMTEHLFEGFNISTMIPHETATDTIPVMMVVVHLNTEEGTRHVMYSYPTGEYPEYSKLFIDKLPLFYPDNRAFQMDIYWWDETATHGEDIKLWQFPLKQCPLINGAQSNVKIIKNFTVAPKTITVDTMPALRGSTVAMLNKIYTSEVNNPFYFPVTGINNVGTGTILGISSAAKALSQGQFGQFPLYAFTTDGVWALEVSATGTFSARQPITRDVCISPDSITQLDSSVLFATDRGIMLIVGSQTECLTDAIASEYPFNVLTDLPYASDLHALLEHGSDTCLPTKPFLAFLKGCRMVYDYVHQHIVVFNPTVSTKGADYTYAYVFSMKSRQWGMMYSNLATTLNSYPDALGMTQDNYMVTFSKAAAADAVTKGLVITRPLKLGDGDTLKSIHTVVQRGMMQRGDANTVLYGSRDLYHWHVIASSTSTEIRNLRGTPYKYYRLASVATLTPDKSLYGATVDVEPRQMNQIH